MNLIILIIINLIFFSLGWLIADWKTKSFINQVLKEVKLINELLKIVKEKNANKEK